MEPRKQEEIAYYNRKARVRDGSLGTQQSLNSAHKGMYALLRGSFSFCEERIKQYCQAKEVLDYGCGDGIHSPILARYARRLVGIDLAQEALKLARMRVERAEVADRAEFIVMDCEATDFADNSFDVIFDGETFSSLDVRRVYPELVRILRPHGRVIAIETFGHNPIMNLNRKLKQLLGRRTPWAVQHILRLEDIELARQHFEQVETHFFHLAVLAAAPFRGFPGGAWLQEILERLDRRLLQIPALQKYAFKVVLILSQPKKAALSL